MAESDSILQLGIEAAREGNREEARNLFTLLTRQEPNNMQAWLWLAGVAESPEERRVALEHVLELDPGNEMATKGLQAMGYSATPRTAEERDAGIAAAGVAAAAATDPDDDAVYSSGTYEPADEEAVAAAPLSDEERYAAELDSAFDDYDTVEKAAPPPRTEEVAGATVAAASYADDTTRATTTTTTRSSGPSWLLLALAGLLLVALLFLVFSYFNNNGSGSATLPTSGTAISGGASQTPGAGSATSAPANNAAVSGTTIVLIGTGTPSSQVEIVAGDQVVGTAPVDADGKWTFNVPVAAGTTPPAYTIRPVNAPADSAAVTGTTATVTGTGTPGSQVEIVVDDKVVGTATVGADGSWSANVPVAAGAAVPSYAVRPSGTSTGAATTPGVEATAGITATETLTDTGTAATPGAGTDASTGTDSGTPPDQGGGNAAYPDPATANPAPVPPGTVLEAAGFAYSFEGQSLCPVSCAGVIGPQAAGFTSSNGTFIQVLTTVRNNTGTDQPVPPNFFVIKDAQGRVYYARPDVSDAYVRRGVTADHGLGDTIPANGTRTSVMLVFDVPRDATGLMLFTVPNQQQGWLVLNSV